MHELAIVVLPAYPSPGFHGLQPLAWFFSFLLHSNLSIFATKSFHHFPFTIQRSAPQS